MLSSRPPPFTFDQFTTWMDPAAAYVPFLQDRHSNWPVSLWKVPTGHASHLLLPASDVYSPGPHARHDVLAFSLL